MPSGILKEQDNTSYHWNEQFGTNAFTPELTRAANILDRDAKEKNKESNGKGISKSSVKNLGIDIPEFDKPEKPEKQTIE